MGVEKKEGDMYEGLGLGMMDLGGIDLRGLDLDKFKNDDEF